LAGGRSKAAFEWPTVALIVAFAIAWAALILGHAAVPWWLSLPALVYLGGLWMSIQHELLHGHPTRWNSVNTTIGFVPLGLWLPFVRYKSAHVQHHRSDLTDPFDDPESTYVDPARWQHAGPLRRRLMVFERTSIGRLTVGVPQVIGHFLVRDLRSLRDRHVWSAWILHLPAAALLAWWLFAVVEVPAWEYVIGFALGGAACSALRSFVEHAAVLQGTRSAIVETNPAMALLFMNNNLHHTHHADPDAPWFDIPRLHREMGSNDIAADGAGYYRGYAQVLGRYLVRPFSQPDHPLSPGARPVGSRGIS